MRKNIVQLNEEEIFRNEYEMALNEYKNAQLMFDYAVGDYIDVAIGLLQAAEIKLNTILKKAKLISNDIDFNSFEIYALPPLRSVQ